MSATLARSEGPADAELISAVRGGDVDAYGQLFERHVAAANRLARQLTSHGDADDLVAEAFTKVLGVLQRGGGPDVAFRAYLLTAVRHVHLDRVRAASHLQPTDDMSAFDPGVPFEDPAVASFESAAAAAAFASLPERWQLVLWHTEVEGQKPAEIAPLLGLSPNSVSALAYRAREGLRQAFLTQHARELDGDTCRWTHQNLGAYVRNGLSKRDSGKVEAHLQDCRSCMAVYLELTEVNSRLSGILAPLLLGSAGAAYLASSLGAGQAGLVLLLGRGRDWVLSHGAATGVTAAVATSVAVATAAAVLAGGGPDVRPSADAPPPAAPSAPTPVVVTPAASLHRAPAPVAAAPPPAPAPVQAPVPPPVEPAPTPAPPPDAPPPTDGPEPQAEAGTVATETPTVTPTPTGWYDVALAVAAGPAEGGATVTVDVSGIDDAPRPLGVQVSMTGTNVEIVSVRERPCDFDRATNTARCEVDSNATLTFNVKAVDPALAWTVTAWVSDAPEGDSDLTNNEDTVTVAPEPPADPAPVTEPTDPAPTSPG